MILTEEGHVWNHLNFGISPLPRFKKLKHGINGRGLLPFTQVNCNRKSYIVGHTNCFKDQKVNVAKHFL